MAESTVIEGRIISEEEFSEKAREWAAMVRNRAVSETSAFDKGKEKPHTYLTNTKWHKEGEVETKLNKSLSYTVKKIADVPDSVRYKFPRHGIFRAYGVGRGRGIASGNKISEANWFDEPVSQNIEKLADIAAEYYGDKVTINAYNMLIKK